MIENPKKELTVGDVVEALDPIQKKVLYFLIGEAVKGSENNISKDEMKDVFKRALTIPAEEV